MKKLCIVFLALIGGAVGANAQTTSTTPVEKKVESGYDSYYKDNKGNEWYTYVPSNGPGKKSNIKVLYEDSRPAEDPAAAYQGNESSSNDGVKKNFTRNINYHSGDYSLPPNNGRQ